MNNVKNDTTFIEDLIKEFPEIKEDVLDEDYLGLTSLQIGCFRRFTQKAIDTNNLDIVKKSFSFVEKNFDLVNPEIRNSLYISYLGKLKISEKSEIERLLPKKLKNAMNELNAYYKSTSKNEKLNKFLNDL